jgi:hypothetical protein
MTHDSESLAPYLDVFPDWLGTLGADAAELGRLLGAGDADAPSGDVRRFVIAGLNYIFKSLDLIPDGIDDLGYCDDAFVLRVAASLACAEDVGARTGALGRLADEATRVEEFLGEDYVKLADYVRALRKGAARGRTVEEIVGDSAVRSSFLHEVASWSAEYKAPAFTRDVKTLIKLKAFLSAKLA